MDIDKIMIEIVGELQEKAVPIQQYLYEPKKTHQIIRRHLIKLDEIKKRDCINFCECDTPIIRTDYCGLCGKDFN